MSYSANIIPGNAIGSAWRMAASYERELATLRRTEAQLREALVREDALLREKDELIEKQQLLSKESDHRLLNGLQIIVSLLRLQSRASTNTEATVQLAAAANRVAMIERVHRHLHCLDRVQTVAFKQYLEKLCCDFSMMLSSDERPEQAILVEGIELNLPSAIAIPLSFVVSELITNAAKYGKGRIVVSLDSFAGKGHALSVSNDGSGLPKGFDPAAGKGLGMRIIRSLVKQIGGELRVSQGDEGQGARFTVLFNTGG
jgi:two-component sensor histidine kinase